MINKKTGPESPRDYLAISVFLAGILAFLLVASLGIRNIDWKEFRVLSKRVSQFTELFEEGPKRIVSKARQGPTPEKGRDVEEFQKHIQLAHRLFNQKKYDEALSEYNRAISIDPHKDSAYYWRGQLLINRGKYESGIKDLKKALDLAPSNKRAYASMGWAYGQMSRYEEGIDSLTRYLEFKPDDGWAYYQRGHYFYKKGQMDMALKDARKSCDLGYKDGCEIYERFKQQG